MVKQLEHMLVALILKVQIDNKDHHNPYKCLT